MTVVVGSKAQVSNRLTAQIAGSNPAEVVDVCLFSFCVLCMYWTLRRPDRSSVGSYPVRAFDCVWPTSIKTGELRVGSSWAAAPQENNVSLRVQHNFIHTFRYRMEISFS